jgi:DNA repair protein RadC
MKHFNDIQLLSILVGERAAKKALKAGMSALMAPLAQTVTDSVAVSARDAESFYGTKDALTKVAAAIELAGRFLSSQLKTTSVLSSPNAVQMFLKTQMRNMQYEVFACLFLDGQNQLIEYCELFRGTVNQTAVYPREVIKKALQLNACAMILAHNHPSGCAEPSRADQALTQAIKNAAGLVDISVLDHLIIAGDVHYSFAQHGLV